MSNETLERSEVVAERIAERFGMPFTRNELRARLRLAYSTGRTEAFQDAVDLLDAGVVTGRIQDDPRDHT